MISIAGLLIFHCHRLVDTFCFLWSHNRCLFYLCYWVQINLFGYTNTFKITLIGLLDFAVAVLLVVRKVSGVDSSIFIEILSFPMFFILKPISYIKFSFHVVIFPLTLLKALKEITLISLGIYVFHLASSVRFPIIHLTFVLGSIRHPHQDNIVNFLLRGYL